MRPISAPAVPAGWRRASSGGCGIRAIACVHIASRKFTASISPSTVLDVIAWGGDPRTLEWFERPREEAIDAALALLGGSTLIEAGAPGGADPADANRRAGAAPAAASAAWTDAGGGRTAPGRSRRRARSCRSVTCCRHERHRPRPICCRRSTTGATFRLTFSALLNRSLVRPTSDRHTSHFERG